MARRYAPFSHITLLVLVALALAMPSASSAVVTFTDIGAGLPGNIYGTNAWGDYDADGDLDLLVSGSTDVGLITRIYRNTGGVFTGMSYPLTGAEFAVGAWGDYDGDNDLDILLCGQDASGTRHTWVYKNNGVFGFASIPNPLPGLGGEAAAWVDYDNDGDLDIFVSGVDQTNVGRTMLARNDGGDVFTIVSPGFMQVQAAAASWGDYDRDGDFDLVIVGTPGGGVRKTVIYRNDGDGVFTDIHASLPPVAFGDVAWGDYDGDGDLDLAVSGDPNTGDAVTKIYRYDGSDVFTDIHAGMVGMFDNTFDWGDYDNNGTLDLLATGVDTDFNPVTLIYQNDGAGGFTGMTYSIRQVGEGDMRWGDYDADGDLDIVQSGRAGYYQYTTIYRSDGAPPNTNPVQPTNLTATMVGDKVRLSWLAETDGQTATSGLSYNLRVGTSPGGSQIMSAMALSSGRRLLPARGNAQERTSWLLDAHGARYYWTVQAIDGAHAGSPFPAELSIDLTGATFTDIAAGIQGTFYGTNVWGDCDGDGDLDLLVAGDTYDGGRITRVYKYSVNGFYDAGYPLAGAAACAGAWGDYDGDNDLDILLCGQDAADTYRTWIYKNNSNGVGFTEVPNSLPGLSGDSAAWVDYDNDGDLDIFIIGLDQTSIRRTVLARNDGGDVFTIVSTSLPDMFAAAACWGDYDRDGDFDVALVGSVAPGVRKTMIYRNDGAGAFTDIGASLPAVAFGDAAWGDYDCDGDLDLVVSGSPSSGGTPMTEIYRNDGADVFTDVDAGLVGLFDSSLDWGDYDNNGTPDLVAAGLDAAYNPVTIIYQNDGDGGFTGMTYSIRQVGEGMVRWGDFDADGDLDLVQSGRAVGMVYTTVYRSSGVNPDTAPARPTNLTSTIVGNKVRLSWSVGTDAQTSTSCLTYNLRVGTTAGGSDIMSAMSLSGGRRLLPAPGNAQEQTSWLVDVRGVRYYWTVQTIDGAYAGSIFQSEQTVNLSGIGEDESAGATRLGAISPNPSSGAVRIPVELQTASDVRLVIYDASGRRVRVLDRSALGAGAHAIDWDGRNDAGYPVAPGIYLCRMQAGSVTSSGTIVRLD
jgi:hypothetical protein